MKNTITERVADFLKRFPPFDLMRWPELLELSSQIKIKYFEKNRPVYNEGDDLHEHFYLINKGAIALWKTIKNEKEVIDHFDEGDVFGLRPLFAKENYAISAITEEESILYCIPIAIFKPMASRNHDIGNYLIESFASTTENPYTKKHHSEFFSDAGIITNPTDDHFELQPISYNKKVIKAQPETAIIEVAKLMNKHRIGSVIIEENDIPKGIITDSDLRKKVATGEVSIQESASKIMSSPVICYSKGTTIAQVQITMMKHNIGHICITKDGTPNSKIIGCCTEQDLKVMRGSNPSVLMKAIQRSNSTKDLRKIREKIMVLLEGYIQQNIPLTHTSKIIFELNDASIKRVIERSLIKMKEAPPVSFAWMSIGSQGRKEQLLHTDQDNALVFEDVDPDQLEETRSYFLKFAKKVNKRLRTIGFDYCDADMMAMNDRWCLSLNEWKDTFSSWTSNTGNDEILLSSIFFDFDITYGNPTLTNELSEHILDITKNNSPFMQKMGVSALRSASPLGFFRQFLVESDG